MVWAQRGTAAIIASVPMSRGAPLGENPLRADYEALRIAARRDLRSTETGECILALATTALRYLAGNCRKARLVSRVPNKEYFSFERCRGVGVLSRPINGAWWDADEARAMRGWTDWETGRNMDAREQGRLAYTLVMAYCAASDLFDRNNKKGPATYFEWVVGHLIARLLGVDPTKRARIVVDGTPVRLTMDYLFDMGEGKPKIHLPLKMSTRERVVQAWAHQRILDAEHGAGGYRGILVVFAETKLDSRNREVVEICVPDQWLAYQVNLATMHRIYYFDPPARYVAMAEQHPVLHLRRFADFFAEKEEVLQMD